MSIPTFIHTITLFNKVNDKSSGKTVVSWHKTILKDCYFGAVPGETQNDNTVSGNNTFICRIPKDEKYSSEYKGEKDKFTLAPGDVIIKGIIEEDVKDTVGNRISDLLNKYKESFIIKAFSDNTILAFEPHYRVSG